MRSSRSSTTSRSYTARRNSTSTAFRRPVGGGKSVSEAVLNGFPARGRWSGFGLPDEFSACSRNRSMVGGAIGTTSADGECHRERRHVGWLDGHHTEYSSMMLTGDVHRSPSLPTLAVDVQWRRSPAIYPNHLLAMSAADIPESVQLPCPVASECNSGRCRPPLSGEWAQRL